MTHAAESLHWYDRDGKPAYTVKAKDGSDRPATLRDARKLNLVPSVTTIIRCAAAPGLELWKANQLMMAALTLPRREGEAEKEWLSRVVHDSKEQARKAAERGTAIHAAIQGAFEDETPTPGFEPHIQGAMREIGDWFPDWNWVAERSFASPLGFGGKVDLCHGHAQFVLDFKTKEFDTFQELKTWDEHAMQLAAYRHGLGLEKARCAIVYVSSTVPGLAKLIEIPEEELQRGWTCFYSLLHFWQAKNTYRSAFERELAA
jgi:hypothetical protein